MEDCDKTLYEQFIAENFDSHKSEIIYINKRLQIIGTRTGARDIYFKQNEGSPGDGVVALYDDPKKKLRLYCIRYGNQIIIVGGGGPKRTRTLQEDPKLEAENYFLRWLSQQITSRLNDDIHFSKDALDFSGNLEFEDDTND
jgi:hypothetical protein